MTFSRFLKVTSTLCFLCTSLTVPYAQAKDTPIQAIVGDHDLVHPVTGRQGMVVSQNDIASQVGLDILKKGGNAVDAAVAMGFAMAVTLPRAGNIGGGGFMLLHLGKSGETIAIDYREMAPAAASEKMFQNDKSEVDRDKATFSYQSSGVPGTVAGFAYALKKYGTMPMEQVMQPAIELAQKGFPVSEDMTLTIEARKDIFAKWPETAKIFLKADGSALTPGDNFAQPDLAWSLKQIATKGADAFYKGEIADRIVADMKANGGLITKDDLAHYEVIERKPLSTQYRGYEVISMPPPSSGGVSIIEILNILQGYDLAKTGYNSAATIHLVAESMKRAYADRGQYMGDPAFVDVPVARLTDPKHADELRAGIKPDRATPSTEILDPAKMPNESHETTHYSVVDKDGNAVSNTYTLNFTYGSGIVAKGTGILLNDEMDDFSSKPGEPNAFGLVASSANAIAPGKRPVSSMSPTMVLKDGELFLVTGSPGGSQIVNVVLQIILNVIDFDMNIMEATVAPHYHHQWLPDVLYMEKGFSPDTTRLLEAMGYKIETPNAMGSTQSILRKDGIYYGAADPRRRGALAVGY